MNLSLFLLGNRTVRTDAVNRTALLDLCFRHGIDFCDFVCEEDGAITFRLSALAARRLMRLCEIEGVWTELLHCGGLPTCLWRYRRRAGLLLGIVAAIALLVVSTLFVWDVRVTGNEDMSREEVLAELSACGFGVGSYIPDLTLPTLETDVLIRSDRISWIAIHMDGTVAVVQVIEHKTAPPVEDTSKPANLVASCDGQIELIELYRGNCVVNIGQAVREGELLVSGLYDSSLYGYRFTRASGKVLARTERQIVVTMPLSFEEKRFSEPKCDEIALKIFGFSLKIFKNSRNAGGSCDIIKEETSLDLFGVANLPFSYEVTRSHPFELCTATRTHEEALELAYLELEERLAALSDDVQLLGKQIKTELDDETLTLYCTVTCIENIAVQREFEITEQP